MPPGSLQGPAEDDLGYLILRKLLGAPASQTLEYFDRSDASPPPGATATAYVLGILPGIALIIAGVLFVYLFLMGSFSTGNTGQFLGRKWDSAMVPVRSGLWVMMLMPLPGFTPLAGVQVLVLFLALLGIGMGSAVWAQAAKYIVSAPIVTVEVPQSAEAANALFQGNVCLHALREQRVLEGSGAAIDWGAPYTPSNPRYAERDQTNPYAMSTPNTLEDRNETWQEIRFGEGGACGAKEIMTAVPNAVPGNSPNANVSNLNREQFNRIAQPVLPAMQAFVSSTNSLAQRIGTDADYEITSADITEYSQAMATFRTAVQAGVYSDPSDLSELELQYAEDISRGGFVLAGAFYWQMERRHDAMVSSIKQAISTLSEPDVPSTGTDGLWERVKNFIRSEKATNEFVETAMSNSDALMREYLAATMSPKEQFEATATAYGASPQFLGVGRWLSGASATLAENLTRIIRHDQLAGHGVDNANPNPILEIKLMGDVITNVATIAMVAGHAFKFKSEGLSSQPVIGKGFSAALAVPIGTVSYLLMLAVFLFKIGFLYANIIPAIPTILWFTAVLSYFIYVIESLAAAPFWAAIHAHPDGGDEWAGRGGSGYPIVLTLTLMPSLMVVGFVLGNAIMRMGGWLINILLFGALEDMNSMGLNLLAFIGILVVYGILMVILIYKSYSLAFTLPKTVLSWMGVNNAMGDLGSSEDKNTILMGAGAAGAAAGGIAQQGLNKKRGPAPSANPSGEPPRGGGGEGGGSDSTTDAKGGSSRGQRAGRVGDIGRK
ncbi:MULTISPECIES: DotA/TraY family protein [unclassified Thioalkalivibrio]|uniref:DotA/TraY family protein n=1 Tax=unclassified Thioalkalivibrio TaxID=2621013 RepID=UPI00039A3DB0|nr:MULTISPECIES: DotA/TraY family protein [unclassified Thioalkalivibrio]